jgi:SAM-dependent methyltransferase
MTAQQAIDAANAAFWDEMCGTTAARRLGVTGPDPASIARFDAWFFATYPYLDRHVGFAELAGRDVLEVGLGYGSVSQRLAAGGARFTGLDIARGPVDWVNHRLAQAGLPGRAVQGSILDPPFPAQSFDAIVAIGCYHHTGDIAGAIAQTASLLRPGGRATVMVYNALSYKRWLTAPRATLRYWRGHGAADAAPLPLIEAGSRFSYDHDTRGRSAPETVLVSALHLERLLRRHFATVSVERENAAAGRLQRLLPRSLLVPTLGRFMGLDLYARAVK